MPDIATLPLPRTERRDRRTRSERMPQVPVTLDVRLPDETEVTVHTAVGVGGWFGDHANAAARELGLDADEITVVCAEGGHR